MVIHDKGIYNRLLLMTGRDPAKLGKPVAEAFQAGFDVTVNGRTIIVLPLPGSWRLMPHTYDFFVTRLKCPICGETTPADVSTNMQTYLRDNPDMASLTVGDSLPIDVERIRRNEYDGYLAVKVPEPGEPIRILQTWECPSCGMPANWAEVVVRNGVIESITAVTFDREHFERSNLVANDVISIAANLTKRPFSELVGQDLVQLLRDKL